LRVEDHDRIRSRRQFEAALLDDLEWLGFTADEGRHPLLRQSNDSRPYENALQQLRSGGQVYVCGCSRKAIGGEHYPGTCRTRGLTDQPGRTLRIMMEPGGETFVDGLHGAQRQDPASEYGDLALRDRDGHWTYQFAVTVDDVRQHVDLVVRGVDLLSSTGRQLRLGWMLGRVEPPIFLHHPLLLNASGEKLSKSSRDSGIRELRRAGVSAEEVIGRAAAAVGLLDVPRPLPADEVASLFR
jgi:glutamyl-tRNA synthetase/glutamyl-Q tRNA(Asp) synthetase